MAVESMRKAYARDEVRELIEAREKAERDQISRLKQAHREGHREGEATKAAEIARLLRARGETAANISELTGLTVAEIEGLD
jgi:predicted transposase/invertase (TIGR01784 family)